MNVLLLQTPLPTPAATAPTWGGALLNLFGPYGIAWLFVIMIVVLILSRWNNRLEIKGVDRAVVIARSLVSVFMWFLVVPFIIFVLVNIFAIVNGLGAINILFLFKWIGLTFSSYGWLIQCALGAESVQGELSNYSPDAIIRLTWIFLPLSFIWLRSIKVVWLRWALIPIIIASLVITRHKKSSVTFITEDIGIENLKKIPIVGSLFEETKLSASGNKSANSGINPNTRKILAAGSAAIMLIGFAVALYWKKRGIGMMVIAIGVGGFVFISPSTDKNLKKISQNKDHAINLNIDSMIKKLHQYKQDTNELELYNTAQQLKQAYKAQSEFTKFPDSLCILYRDYFYDKCN